MRNKTELAQMKKRLKFFDVLPLNEQISEKSIDLIEQFRLAHHLEIPDAVIGATAIVHQIPFLHTISKIFVLCQILFCIKPFEKIPHYKTVFHLKQIKFMLKKAIIWTIISLIDVSIYIILGLLLMNYEDFYDESKGA
jgi:hypothetical protein